MADAFTEHDGRTPRNCINSTVATLCMAFDHISHGGEGYLIANRIHICNASSSAMVAVRKDHHTRR